MKGRSRLQVNANSIYTNSILKFQAKHVEMHALVDVFLTTPKLLRQLKDEHYFFGG